MVLKLQLIVALSALLIPSSDSFVSRPFSRNVYATNTGSTVIISLASSSSSDESSPVNGVVNDSSIDDNNMSFSAMEEMLAEDEEDDTTPDRSPLPSEEEEEKVVITQDLQNLQMKMLAIAAASDRGQSASDGQKRTMKELVYDMEAQNATKRTASLDKESNAIGIWELVYSSTQLFRSSPFFMAGRATCQTEDEALRYDWFCDMHRDALAISEIGKVRQVITPENRLVSEFEVKAGAIPFLSDLTPFRYSGGLPVAITGSIVSSADITPVENDTAWEIFMDTVEIKGSNIPGLRQILDNGLRLESRGLGSFLEEYISSYSNPKPVFRTTFLNDSIRISRDQDNNIFVYTKVSNDSTPTDYKSVESDLGLLKLLGDFNDKITKFYI